MVAATEKLNQQNGIKWKVIPNKGLPVLNEEGKKRERKNGGDATVTNHLNSNTIIIPFFLIIF